MIELAWLIPALPLLGFLATTLTPIRKHKVASGWLCIALMIAATLLALGVASQVSFNTVFLRTFRWAPAGGDATFTMGFLVDAPVALMLAMVTLTSTCIHLFSLGYMAHNPRQTRFFSYISLFTTSMLTMLVASNLLLFFMAWEIMGLCSYLLIGFDYFKTYPDPQQITPARAAIKAFITTRIGDVLLMVGLAYLWAEAGSLDFGANAGQIFDPALLQRLAATATPLGISAATAVALLIFAGTVGKSAQFPLHVWLPDAMEGPTPVSALIHAATMVAAGVFLVVRTYPIFEVSGALPVVAFIGTLTAFGAALIACAQFDIKRILAYSTVSQLGFMVAALGIGGWTAALFHLLTHAFFKALLFLGSGSVIHGMEAAVGGDTNVNQDVRNMGGLRRLMPITFYTYLAGYLSLAGVPLLAGFWSKDEILAEAWSHNIIVWVVLTLATFLTAFYMTRQVVLVFGGEFRGDKPRRLPYPVAAHDAHTPHESAWLMTVPLIILALFAVFAGYFPISVFLGQEAHSLNIVVALISAVAALAGIVLGWRLYRNAYLSSEDSDPLERLQPALFGWLNRRMGIDELYAATIGTLTNVLALAWTWLDQRVIGRFVNGIGTLALFIGRLSFIFDDATFNDGADALADGTIKGGDRTRRIETGNVQDYIVLVFGGVVVLGVVYLYVIRR